MRILLVDDDALILRALSRMLRHHAVSTAKGGAEALFLIRGGHVFDAILCDLHMPGMNGRAFFDQLEGLLPELAARVVFMAGGFCEGDDEAFLATHPLLHKPFDANDVEGALEPLARSHCA
jgi:CheY-like chemotaxis protein